MSWAVPSVDDFKTYFARDFNFATVQNEPQNLDYVVDADITKAITEANINFNTGLYGEDAEVTAVFMYLAAFYLVVNLQNSAKGVASQSKFPISSTSVGGVSVTFQIPERFGKDPYIQQFTQNGYGMKYLSLALPFLIGNITLVEGTTTWT
jgi:hypothetical protein